MKISLSTVLLFTLSILMHSLIIYGLVYVGSLITTQHTSNIPIIINSITVSANTKQNKPPKKTVKQTSSKPPQRDIQKKQNQTQLPNLISQAEPQKQSNTTLKDTSLHSTGMVDSPEDKATPTSFLPTDFGPLTHKAASIIHSNVDSIQASYIQQIALKINQNRFYPTPAKRLKQEGTVVISFTINKRGEITNSSIKTPSTFPLLNNAALRTLGKCKNFDAIPQTLALNTLDLEIPLEYNLTQ